MARKDDASEITASAAEVEAELQRFEAASASFGKIALTSQKNLEKATRALEDLADGEQRVIERVQALVATIGKLRDRQLAQVEHIRAKAETLKARSLVYRSLEQDLAALGQAAGAVSEKLKQPSDELDLGAELGELAGRARDLTERAKGEDFDDLARIADGLRQQLLALRGKLKLLPKPTASA